jgi:hypothetical protein
LNKLKIIHDIIKNKNARIKICMMRYDYVKYLWIKNGRKKRIEI